MDADARQQPVQQAQQSHYYQPASVLSPNRTVTHAGGNSAGHHGGAHSAGYRGGNNHRKYNVNYTPVGG